MKGGRGEAATKRRDTGIFEPLDLGCGIGKHGRIEYEITPVKSAHPETIEMKHFHRNVACFHAFKEGINCLLVIVCGEGCAEPKAITPRWHFAWLACEN
jgi:hypothetical protein